MKRLFTALFVIFLATGASAQHWLQIDNGTAGFSIIKGPVGGPFIQDYFLPPGGGTILTSASAWSTTGNALAGGELLGSTNAQDVSLIANGVEHLGLLASGRLRVNGVSYAWPASNGVGTRVLTNDGSGNLSWDVNGVGTVTSVDITPNDGLTATGGPVTSSGSISMGISDNGIALIKLAQIPQNTILGNNSNGTDDVVALSTSAVMTMLGLSGTNSGDVTLAGENYLSIAGQVITANAVDLTGTNVTGQLKAASFPILTGDVTTAGGSLATTIATNAVTNAKFRQSAGLSVVGRSANTTGDVADITGTTDQVLRVNTAGNALGFGQIATGGITNNAVTNAKFRQSAALSVVGNGTNATADVADITAGADGAVLRRSGTTVAFGTVATAGIGDDQVTFAKTQNIASGSLLGRTGAGSGDIQEIAAGTNGNVLTMVAGVPAWASPSGSTSVFARKTANENENGTTLQNDDHLSVSLEANSVYVIAGQLFANTTNDARDLSLRFSSNQNVTMYVSYTAGDNSNHNRGNSLLTASSATTTNTSNDINLLAAETTYIPMEGIIVTGGSAPTVTLQWARVAGTAGNVTLLTNSYLLFIKQ
jgi:hypothetical protein